MHTYIRRMWIVGAVGFSFFLLSNTLKYFWIELAVPIGIAQIIVNVWVFIVFNRARSVADGTIEKTASWSGTITPIIFAFITIAHVLIPFFLHLL